MVLSKIAILAIKGLGKKFIERISNEEPKPTPPTVYRWISENQENGPLTTASCLQVIREETGLDDSQILEDTEKESIVDEAAKVRS